MDWNLYGYERKKEFDRELEPEILRYELARYQEVFGKAFGIKELLMLEDIRSKSLLAEAVNDVPEFLIDQIGKMRLHCSDTIPAELSHIAENISYISEIYAGAR